MHGELQPCRVGGVPGGKVGGTAVLSSDPRRVPIDPKPACALAFWLPILYGRSFCVPDGETIINFRSILEQVAEGQDLSPAEAEAAFGHVMEGTASEVEMAGLLMGLRAKGLSAGEVAGGVRALRKAMLPVAGGDPATLVD